MHSVSLCLAGPPHVASLGVGLHGVSRRLDVFRLPELWQLHLYSYDGELSVNGTLHVIRPGFVSLIPPGVQVTYRYNGPSEHLYAHVALPTPGPEALVPLMQDAGAETPMLSALMRQAVAAWPGRSPRATAEVWTVLWRVAQLAASPVRRPEAVSAAIAYIESNLAKPLVVKEIARLAGVSHNQLTRLFRAETGCTVVEYIRRRRMDRARHLLRESTLPIQSVASAVGIGDLQAFNKACRRELGASPRAVRLGKPAHGQSVFVLE